MGSTLGLLRHVQLGHDVVGQSWSGRSRGVALVLVLGTLALAVDLMRIFAFFGGALLIGCVIYLFSQDRTD